MLMRRFSFILLLSALFSACQADRQELVFDLDATEQILLTADSLNMSETLSAPRKVFVIGDNIAVFEPQDVDGILHFYDEKGQLLTQYGQVGKAHNEFISPNAYINGETIILLSMDGRFCEINYADGEINVGGIQSSGNKSLATAANFVAFSRDGGYVVDSGTSDDMLVLIGKDGNKSAYNNYPIDLPEKMPSRLKKEIIARCSYSIANSLDTLFMAYMNYPSFGVVSLSDKKTLCARLSIKENNTYRLNSGVPYYKEPILFYTYTTSSRKYFYALFQNGTKKSMHQGGTSEIHVFSRRGELLERYVLDRRIYHFAVAPDDGVIYALGVNGDSLTELYVYKPGI